MKMKSIVAAGCVALALGTWTTEGWAQQTGSQSSSTGTTQAGSGRGVPNDPDT